LKKRDRTHSRKRTLDSEKGVASSLQAMKLKIMNSDKKARQKNLMYNV